MGPEARLLTAVKGYCKAQGYEVLRMSFRPGVQAGFPDLLIIGRGGRHVWLELKAPGNKPTSLQLSRLERLRELGCAASWCDSADKARAVIASAMESIAVHAPGRGTPGDAPGGRPGT